MGTATSKVPNIVLVLATLICGNLAVAQHGQILSVHPNSTSPGTSGLEVTIIGGGFGTQADVRFWIAGTNNPGDVSVSGFKILSPEKLVATIEVAPSASIDEYDVDVSLVGGERSMGAKLFAITAKSTNMTFGCTGAESWRRRIPCKRGTIY